MSNLRIVAFDYSGFSGSSDQCVGLTLEPLTHITQWSFFHSATTGVFKADQKRRIGLSRGAVSTLCQLFTEASS
jgi:hypothetical protein